MGISGQSQKALWLCILGVAVALHGFSVCGSAASPQTITSAYPTSPVTLLLPVPQGDQAQLPYSLALPFFREHSELSAPPVVFLYRPGRGGGYALRDLVTSVPGDSVADGSVVAGLHLTSFLLGSHAVNGNLYKARDITPVTLFARLPVALWTPQDSPLTTVKQFVDKARKQPETLIIGGTGTGTAQHMAHVMLNQAAGIHALYMPFTGSAECAEAARKGRTDACWGYALTPDTMPGMRALAVADSSPSPVLPQTPVFEKYKLSINVSEHFGVCMPSGVASFILAAATDFFHSVAMDTGFQAALRAAGCIPVPASRSELNMLILRQNSAVNDVLRQLPMPGFSPDLP